MINVLQIGQPFGIPLSFAEAPRRADLVRFLFLLFLLVLRNSLVFVPPLDFYRELIAPFDHCVTRLLEIDLARDRCVVLTAF